MANSLGNASLVLSTAGGKLTSGLAQSGNEVKTWAGGITAKIGQSFGGIGATIAGFLRSGPHIAAAAALGFTIYKAVSSPFEKLGELAGIQKTSAALGVSASQFQGLSIQLQRVGLEGDQVNALFGKMGKRVADAASGQGEAVKTFQQLGLNARELLNLPVDEQFKAIADAIAKLPPGGQQAAAAMKLFEEQGVKLLPVLQKGSAGLQEFIDQQKKVGAVLSDAQIKAAADAAKAWNDSKKLIASVWDGLVNRATLIAAPVIKLFGGLVSKGFNLLIPVFDWLGRAIERVSVILEAVGEVLSQWIDTAIGWFKELIGRVFGFADSLPTIEDVVTKVLRTVGVALGYVWDTLKAGVGGVSVVVSYIVDGFGTLVEAFKDTVKDLLRVAALIPGGVGESFAKLIPQVDGFGGKAKKAADDMREWGKNAIASWGSGARDVGAWFDRLDFKRKESTAAARREQDELKAAEYKPTAALLKGSKEAFSLTTKFAFDSQFGAQDANNPVVREQQRGNEKLDRIIRIFGASVPLRAG